VVLSLALISIPLYLSYDRIVEKVIIEKNWQKERFLVNGKYIIDPAAAAQKIEPAVIRRKGQ
jgi:hypothetical protein